jgi:hypothetical protein
MKYKRKPPTRIRSIHDNWENRLDANEQRLVDELLKLKPKNLWAVYLEVMDRMPAAYEKRFTGIINEFTAKLPKYQKSMAEVEKVVGDTLKDMTAHAIDALLDEER